MKKKETGGKHWRVHRDGALACAASRNKIRYLQCPGQWGCLKTRGRQYKHMKSGKLRNTTTQGNLFCSWGKIIGSHRRCLPHTYWGGPGKTLASKHGAHRGAGPHTADERDLHIANTQGPGQQTKDIPITVGKSVMDIVRGRFPQHRGPWHTKEAQARYNRNRNLSIRSKDYH